MAGKPGNLRLPENLTWIARELEKVFATRPRDEWLDLLEAADCPAAPVNEPGRWLDHDQVKALGLRVEAVSDTGQEIVMPGPLIDFSLTPASRPRARCQLLPGITGLRPLWPAAAAAPRHQPGGQPSPPPREPGPAAAAVGPARA